jgi:hypothetical protein
VHTLSDAKTIQLAIHESADFVVLMRKKPKKKRDIYLFFKNISRPDAELQMRQICIFDSKHSFETCGKSLRTLVLTLVLFSLHDKLSNLPNQIPDLQYQKYKKMSRKLYLNNEKEVYKLTECKPSCKRSEFATKIQEQHQLTSHQM